jgi:hypothetical protein
VCGVLSGSQMFSDVEGMFVVGMLKSVGLGFGGLKFVCGMGDV